MLRTNQAHQSIVFILLLAAPTMLLGAVELLTHAIIVRHYDLYIRYIFYPQVRGKEGTKR